VPTRLPRTLRACAAALTVASIIAFATTAQATAAPALGSATALRTPSQIFPGGLFRESGTDSEKAATRLAAAGDAESAALIRQISSQPTAIWLGDWFSPTLLKSVIKRHVDAARQQGRTLVFVTYAIPNRDCGGFSAGGTSYDSYLDWNRTVANALWGTKAVVLIEPDSLAMLSSAKCAGEAAKRLPLLRKAVDILNGAGLTTYLDGGNSRWLKPDVQASWLNQAGVSKAQGFFTNVSNFNPLQAERDYAGALSARVGWKHYIVDVSRNGNGWTGTWCNPTGAALGENPRVADGSSKLDAVLWVKHPGASDGSCNGGPPAGDWFESYALALARNR
jgi:endoglucanase